MENTTFRLGQRSCRSSRGKRLSVSDGRGSLLVAFLQKKLTRLYVVARIGELPAQRIGQSIVRVEQKGNVNRVANLLARYSTVEHNSNATPVQLLRKNRERLEKSEHWQELLIDLCC